MMKPITVKELIEILREFPEDLPIILGDDEELNGVHYAYGCDEILPADKKGFDMYDSIKEDHCVIIL